MTADGIDISELSDGQKVALMERLWHALSEKATQLEPPTWHAEVLAGREAEWSERGRTAEDWKAAREELRRELQ